MRRILWLVALSLSAWTAASQPLPSTAYTRGLLRSTNAEAARTALGIVATNSDVLTVTETNSTSVTNLVGRIVTSNNIVVGTIGTNLLSQSAYDALVGGGEGGAGDATLAGDNTWTGTNIFNEEIQGLAFTIFTNGYGAFQKGLEAPTVYASGYVNTPIVTNAENGSVVVEGVTFNDGGMDASNILTGTLDAARLPTTLGNGIYGGAAITNGILTVNKISVGGGNAASVDFAVGGNATAGAAFISPLFRGMNNSPFSLGSPTTASFNMLATNVYVGGHITVTNSLTISSNSAASPPTLSPGDISFLSQDGVPVVVSKDAEGVQTTNRLDGVPAGIVTNNHASAVTFSNDVTVASNLVVQGSSTFETLNVGELNVAAMRLNAENNATKLVVHDNDWGWDADNDLSSLVSFRMHALGKYKLISTPTSLGQLTVTNGYGDNCAIYTDKLNGYYGFDIPTGYTIVTNENNGPLFPVDFSTFKTRFASTSDIPSSLEVLRKLLGGVRNEKVMLVFNGPLVNLYDLWNSPEDQYSPLAGSQLISNSVSEIVIQDGYFGSVDIASLTNYIDNGRHSYNYGFTNNAIAITDFGVQVTFIGIDATMDWLIVPAVGSTTPFQKVVDYYGDAMSGRDSTVMLYPAYGTNTGLWDYTYGTFVPATNNNAAGYWTTNAGTMRKLNKLVSDEVLYAMITSALTNLTPLATKPIEVMRTLDASIAIRPTYNALKTNETRTALISCRVTFDPQYETISLPAVASFYIYDKAQTLTNVSTLTFESGLTNVTHRQINLVVPPNQVFYWGLDQPLGNGLDVDVNDATALFF